MTDPLLDTPLVQSLGWALIHFVWQGTAIGLATALALRVLAGARPTMRYAVACLSLALMLGIVPVVAGLRRSRIGLSELRLEWCRLRQRRAASATESTPALCRRGLARRRALAIDSAHRCLCRCRAAEESDSIG